MLEPFHKYKIQSIHPLFSFIDHYMYYINHYKSTDKKNVLYKGILIKDKKVKWRSGEEGKDGEKEGS